MWEAAYKRGCHCRVEIRVAITLFGACFYCFLLFGMKRGPRLGKLITMLALDRR